MIKLKNTIELSIAIRKVLNEKNIKMTLNNISVLTLFINYVAQNGKPCVVEGKTIYFCTLSMADFAQATKNSKTSIWNTFKPLVEAGIMYKRIVLYPYTEWGIDLSPYEEK